MQFARPLKNFDQTSFTSQAGNGPYPVQLDPIEITGQVVSVGDQQKMNAPKRQFRCGFYNKFRANKFLNRHNSYADAATLRNVNLQGKDNRPTTPVATCENYYQMLTMGLGKF
ncbi:hypothetical protein NBH20_07395 [Rhizobium sp. S153]|uniref:Uncharacterized protein n=1 Tax=Ciceribacter sichuanensis TaxID=2949647 RepID=A0ABT0V8S2_9HYPH|nr:hypothetical protein [Ciceribacter sp. S153]MCM2400975.1 hypothetical protein [Ciceribacter sp. S153]